MGYINGKAYTGAYHIMSNGVKMTGSSHSGNDAIIYDTPQESFRSARTVGTTMTMTTTTTIVVVVSTTTTRTNAGVPTNTATAIIVTPQFAVSVTTTITTPTAPIGAATIVCGDTTLFADFHVTGCDGGGGCHFVATTNTT